MRPSHYKKMELEQDIPKHWKNAKSVEALMVEDEMPAYLENNVDEDEISESIFEQKPDQDIEVEHEKIHHHLEASVDATTVYLQEIGFTHLLTAEQEVSIARRIAKG